MFAAGRELHDADGVALIPMAANLDVRKGSDASILIFRRGTIDAALMAANPKLKLIQRIGARADSLDLKAAAARGILVSCLPRRTLQYTAEHAKSRATLTPPLKSPSALISLRKIGIGKSSFASNRDPTQEVDSHK